MTKIVGIYKITSPSGKVYIGQSWNIKHRWMDYGKKTTKNQRMLNFSFNKYGKKAHTFEVCHELPHDISQQVLDEYEQLYMDLYRDCGVLLLNCREAGSKGKLSEETKRKVSESLKGNIPWNKGMKGVVKMSEETKQKMRQSALGKSDWNIGRKMPEKTREAIRKANLGSKRTEEQRLRLSNALKGKPYHGKNNGKKRTPEVVEKIRQIQLQRTKYKGEDHPNAKLKEQDVIDIRNKYKPYIYTIGMICKEYKLSRTNVKDILKRKIWKNI